MPGVGPIFGGILAKMADISLAKIVAQQGIVAKDKMAEMEDGPNMNKFVCKENVAQQFDHHRILPQTTIIIIIMAIWP